MSPITKGLFIAAAIIAALNHHRQLRIPPHLLMVGFLLHFEYYLLHNYELRLIVCVEVSSLHKNNPLMYG